MESDQSNDSYGRDLRNPIRPPGCTRRKTRLKGDTFPLSHNWPVIEPGPGQERDLELYPNKAIQQVVKLYWLWEGRAGVAALCQVEAETECL